MAPNVHTWQQNKPLPTSVISYDPQPAPLISQGSTSALESQRDQEILLLDGAECRQHIREEKGAVLLPRSYTD